MWDRQYDRTLFGRYSTSYRLLVVDRIQLLIHFFFPYKLSSIYKIHLEENLHLSPHPHVRVLYKRYNYRIIVKNMNEDVQTLTYDNLCTSIQPLHFHSLSKYASPAVFPTKPGGSNYRCQVVEIMGDSRVVTNLEGLNYGIDYQYPYPVVYERKVYNPLLLDFGRL
jgi:hypothetical protein